MTSCGSAYGGRMTPSFMEQCGWQGDSVTNYGTGGTAAALNWHNAVHRATAHYDSFGAIVAAWRRITPSVRAN